MNGCKVIIGVDRIPERLAISKACGATHTINTLDSDLSLEEVVKSVTGGNGSTITVDTTGNVNLIRMGMDFTADRGQMILLGVAPMDATLAVPIVAFMQVSDLRMYHQIEKLKFCRQGNSCAVVLKEILCHRR